MSLRDALDEALDASSGGEVVEAEHEGRAAKVDVDAVGPIGIRVKRVKIDNGEPIDVQEAAKTYPRKLRALGEEVQPVEVAPRLGGTTLRTKPEEMHKGEFFDVDVRSDGSTGIRRLKVNASGDREEVPWSMTRDQLGRLLDDLDD